MPLIIPLNKHRQIIRNTALHHTSSDSSIHDNLAVLTRLQQTEEVEQEEAEDDEGAGDDGADGEGESGDDELVEEDEEGEKVLLVEGGVVEFLLVVCQLSSGFAYEN